jgi:hypothetical protein
VIARQQQGPPCQLRMAGKHREELGPFGRPPGIGCIAANEDEVSGPLRVDGIEARQHPCQPFVAALARPPALDAEAVTLADDMEVPTRTPARSLVTAGSREPSTKTRMNRWESVQVLASSAKVMPPEADPLGAASTFVATVDKTGGPPSIERTPVPSIHRLLEVGATPRRPGSRSAFSRHGMQ